MSPSHTETHTGLQTLTGGYIDNRQFLNSWLPRPLILKENIYHKSQTLKFTYQEERENFVPASPVKQLRIES